MQTKSFPLSFHFISGRKRAISSKEGKNLLLQGELNSGFEDYFLNYWRSYSIGSNQLSFHPRKTDKKLLLIWVILRITSDDACRVENTEKAPKMPVNTDCSHRLYLRADWGATWLETPRHAHSSNHKEHPRNSLSFKIRIIDSLEFVSNFLYLKSVSLNAWFPDNPPKLQKRIIFFCSTRITFQ